MKIFSWIVFGLSVVVLGLATTAGMLMNYLIIFLLASSATMIIVVIVAAFRKQLDWNAYKSQFTGRYLLQGLLRNATWLVCGFCVYIAILPVQFSAEQYISTMMTLLVSIGILCVLDWMPRHRLGVGLNVSLSIFLAVLLYQLFLIYTPPNSKRMTLSPPFKGEWYVFHGGDSALINHHHFAGSQKYAMDIMLAEDGPLPLQQVKDLNQYKTLGQVLYAPVDGKIVAVQNSLSDQQLGQTDIENLAGNHVVIEVTPDRFVLLAHLKQSSIVVDVGDIVTSGQEIGQFGNSGNTSQPHLHIQVMTTINFDDADSEPIPMIFNTGSGTARAFKRNDILAGD